MRAVDVLKLRIRSLLRSGQVGAELDEELRAHIDAHVDELVASGMRPERARTEALRAFGGVERTREAAQDTWRTRPLHDAWQDLRYGVRSLVKTPTFTVVALATIALGVGATTAIFSVVNGVLLQPLPYPGSDRIVSLVTHQSDTGRTTPRLTGGDLVDVRAGASALESDAFYWGGEIGVRGGGRAEMAHVWFVTPRFFDVLGVPAMSGRTLNSTDVERGAVATAGFAADRFGSAPAALGQRLDIDGLAYEIVGVMPADFRFPARAEVWVAMDPQPENLTRSAYNYTTIARVRRDASVEQANVQLATITGRLRSSLSDFGDHKTLGAVPLRDRLVGPVEGTVYLLAGAVALLLLIACANVANLLLARATARSREIALRAALGANRWRIVRQLTIESLILGIAGGVLGIAFAIAGTAALVQMAPSTLPRLSEVRVDTAVLLFGVLAAVVSSLVFGMAPAWQASRVDLRDRLVQGARGSTAGPERLRGAIAIAEVALAVVLATGAGLLFRSFMSLNAVDMGFRTPGLLVMQTHVPSTDLDALRDAVRRLERVFAEVAGVPGVASVAGTYGLPMSPIGSNGMYAVEGKHVFGPGQPNLPQANFRVTTPGYFKTMGIPVVRGRDFTTQDLENAPFVAIISESIAREVFPGEDPIGRRIQCGLDSLEPMTIVGIVGDIRDSPAEAPGGELFMPLAQHPSRAGVVHAVIRTNVSPGAVVPAIAARVREIDAEISTKFETMESVTAGVLATPRFRTWLVGTFAALALALAVAGIYGLMAYLTTQRAPELGIRLALGAGRGSVLALVIGMAARLAGAGIAAGLVVSLASRRVMESLVAGVEGFDVVIYAAVGVIVLGVSAAAALVPAWRASRIDPLAVLRQ
jgi:putative ABC transport system permease protein